MPVQDLREFISQYGPDVTVLVTWSNETKCHNFVTVGSERIYSDDAVMLRNHIAKALGLLPLEPTKEDRRHEHPNVALTAPQLRFLIWNLGRLAAASDASTKPNFKKYVTEHHDAVHEILGQALENLNKAPK